MAEIVRLISWNVRGLGDPMKRYAVFNFLQAFQPAIICLQETHLEIDTLSTLKRSWIGHSFHSTHSGYSRGVSVLIHRNIVFQSMHVRIDHEGRYVCLRCKLFSRPFLIIALYIPPPYNSAVLREVMTFVDGFPGVPILMLGDFNNVIHPYWDRLHSDPYNERSPITKFGELVEELSLLDLWRARNPGDCQFSCHSRTHDSLSRIDMALGTDHLLECLEEIRYLPRGLSDHSPLLVKLNFSPLLRPPLRLWALNAFWLRVIDHQLIASALEDYISYNAGSVTPAVYWDALKASLRGAFIQAISRAKVKSRQFGEFLQGRVVATEQTYVASGHQADRLIWDEAQKAYNTHLMELAQQKRFFARQTYFEEGEKAGHLLALVAKAQRGSSFILAVRTVEGEVVTTTNDILPVFHTFYADLYTSRLTYSKPQVRQFLQSIDLPTLSDTDRALLEEPLTLEEMQDAVSTMPEHKAPGADGLPAEVYKRF